MEILALGFLVNDMFAEALRGFWKSITLVKTSALPSAIKLSSGGVEKLN